MELQKVNEGEVEEGVHVKVKKLYLEMLRQIWEEDNVEEEDPNI